jgi:PAS domain S-box-containing protein
VYHLQILVESFVSAAQRRRAGERLRRSEYEYRMLFDHNPHPMWVYDVDTLAFLAANRAAVQQYGYSQEEFLRMTLRDIRPEAEIPAMERIVRRLPEAETYRALHRHQRRNGEVIDVEITADPIEFEGRAARLVKSGADHFRLLAGSDRVVDRFRATRERDV